MDDLQVSPVDGVVLAWLVVPRKKPGTADLAKAIAPLLGASVEDAKKVAEGALGRLKAAGLIERDTRLMLTKEGRRRALVSLDATDLPKGVKFDWVKKILVLRAIDMPVTVANIKQAGTAAWLATRVLIARHGLKFKAAPKPSAVIAALAWKAVGRDEVASFSLKEACGPLLLRGATDVAEALTISTDTSHESPAPVAPVAAEGLSGFATSVRKAAQTSSTGRWHGNKVFISHVWEEFRRQGVADSMTFEDFQGRLIEANRAQLVELSRADLVAAMPHEDVTASETSHMNASFHFVRLDDR